MWQLPVLGSAIPTKQCVPFSEINSSTITWILNDFQKNIFYYLRKQFPWFSAVWRRGQSAACLVARRRAREPLFSFHLCSGCQVFQSKSSTWWGILPALVVLQTFKLALNQLLLESPLPVPCYLPIYLSYTSPCCNKVPYNSGLKTKEFILACGLRRQQEHKVPGSVSSAVRSHVNLERQTLMPSLTLFSLPLLSTPRTIAHSMLPAASRWLFSPPPPCVNLSGNVLREIDLLGDCKSRHVDCEVGTHVEVRVSCRSQSLLPPCGFCGWNWSRGLAASVSLPTEPILLTWHLKLFPDGLLRAKVCWQKKESCFSENSLEFFPPLPAFSGFIFSVELVNARFGEQTVKFDQVTLLYFFFSDQNSTALTFNLNI